MVGLNIMGPLLPYHVPPEWIGVILSGQYAAQVVGQLVFGWLSDKFSRKAVLAFIMLVDAALFIASGFCNEPAALLAVRIAVGFAAPVAVSLAWVSDLSTPAKLPKNMGMASGSFNVGVCLGSAVGGLVTNWTAACVISGLVPLINFLWIVPLTTPAGATGRGGTVSGVLKTLLSPEWLCLALASSGHGLFVGIYLMLIPLALKEEYGTEPWVVAIMLLSCGVVQFFIAVFVVPKIAAFGIRRGGMQVPLCLLDVVAISAIVTLALLFEFHAPVYTIIIATPIAYSGTWTSLGLVNIGNTWCALTTGKNAVGSITASIRTVLGVAWAISPVLCFALYDAAPPSAATQAGMPAGSRGGRAALPLAMCAAWYTLYGAVCFGTLKAGHPVKPPSFPPKPKPTEPTAAPAAAVAPEPVLDAAPSPPVDAVIKPE